MTREYPRMSINQLAKYLSANARQRRRIIEKQKEPATFMVNYYEPAAKIIKQFMQNPTEDNTELIVSQIDSLYAQKPSSDFDESRNNSNAEALASFLDIYEDIVIDGLAVKPDYGTDSKMLINNLEISIKPDMILSGTYRGNEAVGIIKLFFSKSDSLETDSGMTLASVMHRYLQENFDSSYNFSRRHCQVVDVFAQNVFDAPPSVKNRFSIVEDACEEIKLWWDVI